MLAPTSTFATTAPCARAATRAAPRRASVAARASVTPNASSNVPVTSATVVDRRAFVRNAALVAFTAAVTTPREAKAFLGFGENKEEKYTAETTAIIAQVKATLEMAPGAEGREESINQTRQMTNAWVAKYRRDNKTTGKPSYGQVYSALNAVSGHFNNFGTKYPFPAKRKDRVFAEFESAELLLSRGR